MTGGLTWDLSFLLPTTQIVPIPCSGADEVVLREHLSAADKRLVHGPEYIIDRARVSRSSKYSSSVFREILQTGNKLNAADGDTC